MNLLKIFGISEVILQSFVNFWNVLILIICTSLKYRLKVDLQKAQSACEQLTEQLMNAEAAKEKFEVEAKNFREEAELARKAKEAALEERVEATKKHEVLSIYFNQREAELQKQLGVQTQRLGEVEVDSESVSKKLDLLYEELESYKSQCKSLKQEMEEQVINVKSRILLCNLKTLCSMKHKTTELSKAGSATSPH